MALDRVDDETHRYHVSVCSSTDDMFWGTYEVYAKTKTQARWKALKRANEEWPKGFSIRVWKIERDPNYPERYSKG